MSLKNYLKLYRGSIELNIVGPLWRADISLKEPTIYVDGGASFQKEVRGITVGDGDSFKQSLDVKLPEDKDYSDLSYVLQEIGQGYKVVNLLGFLGGRKDHELINLAEVHQFLLNCESPTQVHFDKEITAFSKGQWEFFHEGIFSLFSFEQNQVHLTGDCQYPILTDFKALSSHGLSNIGKGEICLENKGPLFFFR